MPDGSAECGAILARLALLESLQRQQTQYFSERIDALDAKLEDIKIRQAKDDGESRALARLGGWVIFILTAIGSLVAWATSENGHGLLKKMID